MKTGLKKSQKTTEIFFDEANPIITVSTYNTDLKNRLSAYSEKHPDLCKLVDDSEDGRLMFEIEKGRFCSDSQSHIVKNDALLQVSLQRNTNIS